MAKDKIVARSARLVRRVETWTLTAQRLFAADCAERVLPLFEAVFPNDGRPREAIRAAREETDSPNAFDSEVSAVLHAAAACADAAYSASSAAYYVAAYRSYAPYYYYTALTDALSRKSVFDKERKWQTDRLMWYLYPSRKE